MCTTDPTHLRLEVKVPNDSAQGWAWCVIDPETYPLVTDPTRSVNVELAVVEENVDREYLNNGISGRHGHSESPTRRAEEGEYCREGTIDTRGQASVPFDAVSTQMGASSPRSLERLLAPFNGEKAAKKRVKGDSSMSVGLPRASRRLNARVGDLFKDPKEHGHP